MGPAPEVAAVRRAVRAALSDLEPGDLVLAAVSGGADSLALADALAFEAPRAGLRGGAVTVDHGLQAGSGDRAVGLADWLRTDGLDPVELLRVHVGDQGGPEAAARAARYAALDDAAHRLGAAIVLLGHTLDDQAETVLLGLARGSGPRSLAGMPPERGRYRRPLLGLPRDTVRAAAPRAVVWDDPHNADPAFTRSRVRHDLLPVLEKALGPGVAAALARTADQLRADAEALDEWARTTYDRARRDADAIDVTLIEDVPAAVRTRVLRLAALDAGCPHSALTAGHVAALDRLVTDWRGQGPLHLPGGIRATRACGTLALNPDPTDP